MNRKTFINKYLIDKKNISIFTGAGISRPSGLPLASKLLEYILHAIMPEEIADKKDFILSVDSLPFETFIGQMCDYTGNYSIFNIFSDKYEPNENHIFASKMLEKGYLERIYTVNFDMLYETALNKSSKEFGVLYDDKQFSDKELSNQFNKIVKLHGSAHDIHTMKFVLDSITNKKNRSLRANAVRYIFGQENNIIVIFGYSNSDIFDITPTLHQIIKNRATVVFVDHNSDKDFIACKNSEVKLDPQGKTGPARYPFIDYPGFYIQDNTVEFVKEWYLCTFKEDLKPCVGIFQEKWKYSLSNFIVSLHEFRYKFLGTIYCRIGKYTEAQWCYEKLACMPKHEDYAFACQQLAQIFNIKGDRMVSNKYLDKAMKRINNPFRFIGRLKSKERIFIKISCIFTRAENCLKGGDYHKAIDLYNKCIVLARKNKLHDKEIQCLQGLSFAYYGLKDCLNSFKSLEYAINAASNEEDLWILSDLYINKAELLQVKERFGEAIEIIDTAIEIKTNIHDYPRLISAYIGKGTILKNDHNFEESLRIYDLAQSYIEKYELPEEQSRLYYQKAILYLQHDFLNYTQAYNLLIENIPLCIKQGNKEIEGRSRILLGQLYESNYKVLVSKVAQIQSQHEHDALYVPFHSYGSLKLDFEMAPLNLSPEQIKDEINKFDIDGTIVPEDKYNKLIELASFYKRIANEEIVKGLSLVKKINTDYYNKVLEQYT